MYRIAFALLATFLAAPPVFGQSVKQVEGTNLPEVQPVEVVNPAGAARFQLVGFTTAAYSPNLGGMFGAAMKCQSEFADSRICTVAEVRRTTSIPAGLAGTAWVDADSNCNDWTFEGGSAGAHTVGATGSLEGGGECLGSVERPIACCALVP